MRTGKRGDCGGRQRAGGGMITYWRRGVLVNTTLEAQAMACYDFDQTGLCIEQNIQSDNAGILYECIKETVEKEVRFIDRIACFLDEEKLNPFPPHRYQARLQQTTTRPKRTS